MTHWEETSGQTQGGALTAPPNSLEMTVLKRYQDGSRDSFRRI